MKTNRIAITIIMIFLALPLLASENTGKCDLGAEMILFDIVKKLDNDTVLVKITARVKNLGTIDFNCNENQAIAELSEGSTSPDPAFVVVAKGEIRSLGVDRFFDVVYEREWKISDLEKFGEQPHYLLQITFDPGILQDNNPLNDDSVAKNNKRERTTKQLRGIWAARDKLN